MRSKAARGFFALLTLATALVAGPSAEATATAPTGAATVGPDGAWTVVAHPAPPGKEDEPLRGAWTLGDGDIWAVGHAYVDMSWEPWGVRCVQLACTPLQLTGPGDSPVATAAAIDGTSASDVWVVGRHLVKHYDGSQWETIDTAEMATVT